MIYILIFILGMFVGAWIGMLTIALCKSASWADEQAEKYNS